MIASLRRFDSILEELLGEHAGITGALLADATGLPIVDSFRNGMDIMAVAAMSTLLLRSAQTVFKNLHLQGGEAIVLEGEDAVVLVEGLESGASLILIAKQDADLHHLRAEMARVRQRMAALLKDL